MTCDPTAHLSNTTYAQQCMNQNAAEAIEIAQWALIFSFISLALSLLLVVGIVVYRT